MLADDRDGDFESIGDFGFGGPVPQLSRASSLVTRLNAGHTVALDDPIGTAWLTAEEVEFWRDEDVFYFVPCVFEGSAIAVLTLGRKESDEPFNSEDLALLTAVAGQVATAIENGRLYRQLHVKADELGRMREFNENILESLDDGLVVFDANERIVRWNRALEVFYGVGRDDAIGLKLSDVFDVPFVDALRAALGERPQGATLFKAPLTGWRFGAGLLKYLPEKEGIFRSGGPLLLILSGGADYRLPIGGPVGVVARLRYDYQRFNTDELQSSGFGRTQDARKAADSTSSSSIPPITS